MHDALVVQVAHSYKEHLHVAITKVLLTEEKLLNCPIYLNQFLNSVPMHDALVVQVVHSS